MADENADDESDEDDDRKFLEERPKPIIRNAGVVIVGVSIVVAVLNWREIGGWIGHLMSP